MATRIEFIEQHQPGLISGSYKVTVEQNVTAPRAKEHTHFKAEQRFGVYGDRFSLRADDVVAVFPPAGSLGDHANVLPHIALDRSTLPWERVAAKDVRTLPWLALLVFAEGEIVDPGNTTIAALENAGVGWPGIIREEAQHAEDPVTVIDVPASLLAAILPAASELAYLAHVRRPVDDKGVLSGEEWAIVIANRLPLASGASVAHLVSLEQRFQQQKDEKLVFDYRGASGDARVRLISLWSWRFSCLDEKQNLENLLQHLDREPATLRLPAAALPGETFLAKGYVPCPHLLRAGERTVSWYHGPLVPFNTGEQQSLPLPAHGADALLRYDGDHGMLDAGYASAWELGRMLALNNSRVAQALYEWRHHSARFIRGERHLTQLHLPALGAQDQPPLPDIVAQWITQLALLHGVPFNYLVPDERLLPPDSLRFFDVDRAWLAALFDGAFSIGRAGSIAATVNPLIDPVIRAILNRPMSGFLMRSSVVSGWPTLAVDAFHHTFAPGEPRNETLPASSLCEPLRVERLSPSVLFGLYVGQLNVLDMHQPPEAIHFGVHREATSTGIQLTKGLRNGDGDEIEQSITVDQRPGGKAVIDLAGVIAGLKKKASQMGFSSDFTSAQFALEMVEGVRKVRFVVEG